MEAKEAAGAKKNKSQTCFKDIAEDVAQALQRVTRKMEQFTAYLAALNFIYALREFGYDFNVTRELIILAGILFEEGRL